MNLVELFENAIQFQALNGVPLANGRLYVYALGRTRLMDTWSDIEGESLNTNPIILDDAGQCHCYVSDAFDYTLVICDEYNNEVFSIDKYLYSKGEHSHADVAVAPSEHIGVSSYHVGETTVYVPYIVGELGKTYHGIEPIVVNNQENKISARNIALGVQEPLFFVEDSESACIIGASGLQPSGNYATVEWVTEHDYMQKEKLEFNESGQVTGFDGSAFAAGYVDPSDFIPWSASGEFQSAGNYATTEDLTAYQPSGDYYSASNPSGFINSDAISAMATTGFVADVSADITAMIPTGDYLTKESADTLYQPLGDYATTADLTGKQDTLTFGYTDDQISTINGSGIYGQGGSVTGEYELSAGNGISINNDPINQKTVISVSGDYATNSDLQTVSGEITAMIPTALTGDYLTKDSADTLYYGIDNPNGYITGVDLTPYQLTADMTAYQQKGNYLTADALDSLSGNWETVTAKLDTTAFSDVSGTFLTAHQDISNKLDTTAFSDVSGSFLTAVPDTYLQNTDLSTEDGKVTAISGIPLSAGGDVPEGVMVESGLEYNAVNEISAYNGSAIAQYGAEKQWLQHDDTLVHAANSAQYALGVNLSAVAQLLGVDETVLYSATPKNYGSTSSGESFQLSENISAFERLKLYVNCNRASDTYYETYEIDNYARTSAAFQYGPYPENSVTGNWFILRATILGTTCNVSAAYNAYTSVQKPYWGNKWFPGSLYKVIGIGRKEV